MTTEIRIVTNDRYAQHACVVTRAQFAAMCADAGFEDAEFIECGPVVTSEDDVREHCGELIARECIEQFQQIQAETASH